MITTYLSRKIKVLSFIVIYLVLVIHSFFPGTTHFSVFYFFETFLNSYFCNIFLPLFLILSGYLFYANITEPNRETWIRKFKSRFKSLLIPYIVWNIVFLVVMITLQMIPVTSVWVNSDIISKYFSGSFYYSVWLIFSNPINFPLWFISHLIIIVVFTPLIWFLLNSKTWYIPILTIIIVSFKSSIALSFLFFCVGSVLSIKKVNISLTVKSYWIYVLLFLTLIIGTLISLDMMKLSRSLLFYSTLFPMLLLWFGYDKLINHGLKFNFLNQFLPYTFFIYVFHEPYLNIFKKLILRIGDSSVESYWVAYLISPILMIFFAYVVGRFWEKISPKSYAISVGGRI